MFAREHLRLCGIRGDTDIKHHLKNAANVRRGALQNYWDA